MSEGNMRAVIFANGDASDPNIVRHWAAQADLINAETKRSEIGVRHQERMVEDQNRDLDRQSRERVAMLQLARDLVMHPEQAEAVEPLAGPSERKFNEGESE